MFGSPIAKLHQTYDTISYYV